MDEQNVGKDELAERDVGRNANEASHAAQVPVRQTGATCQPSTAAGGPRLSRFRIVRVGVIAGGAEAIDKLGTGEAGGKRVVSKILERFAV